VGKVYFQQGDLRNKKWLDEIFEKQISIDNPIDSVIHFAGLKSVIESISKPTKYWDVNINSTLSLLSSMEKFNCNSVVFSSSATIYKPVYKGRITENSLKEPINPYGNTKFTIEKILKDLYISDPKKWRIINLRYFNPVGAHESGKIGEEPLENASNLFPVLGKVISGEMSYLSIYGNDWPTKDGTCIRDYIHVMDLSEAHFSALQFLKNNPTQFQSINIGTGEGYTVLEIIEKYSKLNNVEIPYKFADRRSGDASSVVADNSLALELLNWIPLKTIEDCCIDSFRFLFNKLNKIK
jgi:UDP-glucose 4-epimerase